MSSRRLARMLCLSMAMLFVVTGCTWDSTLDSAGGELSERGNATGNCGGNINVSGSSTVEPVSRKAAELYEAICPDAIITVDGPGTGDGFKLFCSGDIDISDASRTIKDPEAEACADAGIEFTEIKVAFDGIAVMTNPSNIAVECLSFIDLYAMLGGQSEGFEDWSDANDLATELGSDVAPYPDAPLAISAPGTESGTYDSFVEIVLEGIGEEQEGEDGQFIRQDFAGNADDNVIIEGVAGSDSSLGWVGFAFAEGNLDRVKEVAVAREVGGECVTPTIETIADGSYPVSRALYIYVNNARAESNPALAGYIDFYLGDGYNDSVTKAFGATGYVPLPADELAEVRSAWEAAK